MSGYLTPAGYSDGYTDESRPNGTSVQHGGVQYTWFSVSRLWFTTSQLPVIPAVNLVAATPTTSPNIAPTSPTLWTPGMTASTNLPAPTFPPLQRTAAPPATLSARDLLEMSPEVTLLKYYGVVYVSSRANDLYGPIGPVTEWALPHDLAGYGSLGGSYHHVPPNPLAAGITEGDTVLAAMNAFFQPVDMVLSENCRGYTLASLSEATARVTFTEEKDHVSRMDRSWAFHNNGQWTKFAIVEFKRSGALRRADWNSPEVTGRGDIICRQLKKHATSCVTRFVACCDGEKLVLIWLGGEMADWNRNPNPPATPAQIRWIEDTGEIKRNLFVFLKQALDAKLREYRLLQ